MGANRKRRLERAFQRLVLRGSRIPWARRTLFRIYHSRNVWGDADTRSGTGSNLVQTAVIRRELPGLFARWQIHSVVDVPCGDGFWWRHVDHGLDRYIGVDVVPELVAALEQDGWDPCAEFLCLDAVKDELPRADAVFCRDLLVHFADALVLEACRNFKASGATYLVTTTFPGRVNAKIETGQWRPIDLEAPPFSFPSPLEILNEGCTEAGGAFADKSLGVWRLADLPL